MHPLFEKGKEYLQNSDYQNAKNCFSELMYMYEDVPFDQYPQIVEALHFTLSMEMLAYFMKNHPEMAPKIYSYITNCPSYKEHLYQPDFDKLETFLNADQL